MAIMVKPLLPLLLLLLFLSALSAAASLSSQRQDPERRLRQCVQECCQSQRGEQCVRQCEEEYRREKEQEGRGAMTNEGPLDECLKECGRSEFDPVAHGVCTGACYDQFGKHVEGGQSHGRDDAAKNQDPERRLQQCVQECRQSQQGEQCLHRCEEEYRREVEKEGRGRGRGRDTMRNADPKYKCYSDCHSTMAIPITYGVCMASCNLKYGVQVEEVAQRQDPERRLQQCKQECRQSQKGEQCQRQCEEEYRREMEREGGGGSGGGRDAVTNENSEAWDCFQRYAQYLTDDPRLFRVCMARCYETQRTQAAEAKGHDGVSQRKDPEQRLQQCKQQCRQSQQGEQCQRQCEEEYRREKEQEGRGGNSRGGEEFINEDEQGSTWDCFQSCAEHTHAPKLFRVCMARCEDAALAEE